MYVTYRCLDNYTIIRGGVETSHNIVDPIHRNPDYLKTYT